MNFTCPNRDGVKGYGGCTYCSSLGSGDFAGKKTDSMETQFKNIKKIILKKWPNSYYIPYFQAYTNTYAPLSKLKPMFEKAITLDKKIVGLAIATRCDCLEDDKIDYLSKLNKKIPVQIELGLQTSNEKTSQLINRCHTNLEFINCVKKLKKENIEVIVHIMNGLPGESEKDMLNTIHFINKLNIDGIKIHELCVLKNTKMGLDYLKKPFKILTLDEYTDIVCKQISILNKNIIIHRLSADAAIDSLIEPKWTIKKLVVMNEIDKKLRKLNIYQGDNYTD